MSSRTLLNLLLLAGLGALIALTVFEPGIEKPPTILLSSLAADDISRVRLMRPERADIVLQREQGEWWMAQPYKAPATPFLDQNLDNLLSAAASAHYPQAELDAKLVGLSPAAATLDLGELTLHFGDVEPVHGNRYVQAGDTVYLIPDHYAAYTTVKAIELVSPALLPKGTHITGISLPALPARGARAGDQTDAEIPAITLRRIDGAWTILPYSKSAPGATSEPMTPASGDDLTRWLDEWRHAQAIDVTPITQDQPQTRGPDARRIELRTLDHDPIHFQIITTSPDLVLARPDYGLSYRFSPEQALRLLYPPVPRGGGQQQANP